MFVQGLVRLNPTSKAICSRYISSPFTLKRGHFPKERALTFTRVVRDQQRGQTSRADAADKVEVKESARPESLQWRESSKPVQGQNATLLSEQTVSNKEQRKADWAIMKEMSKYLWPKDDLGAKVRVSTAFGLLVGAKLLNVQVPFYFKSIVDSMNIDFAALGGTAWTVGGAMIVAYGSTRIGAALFQEVRNAVFASVAQKAIRRVACNVFDHLLKLDLKFHLARQTGGLTRAIDRGTKGISFLLTSMVFHIIPTALEISMV